MILEKHNLRVRVFENCNIARKHYKNALSFTWRLDDQHKMCLFAAPFEDDSITFMFGNGHKRIAVNSFLRKEFGCENVKFSTLLAYFSEEKPITGFVHYG